MARPFNTVSKYILISGFLCSVATVPLNAQASDMSNSSAAKQEEHAQGSHDLVQGAHVEGHIAFLHAELAITPAQEPLWSAVASAMREDVKNMQEAEARAENQTGKSETAIQSLEHRLMFANLRAQGEARFLKAFSPLYDSLSDTQKATADDLLAPRMD